MESDALAAPAMSILSTSPLIAVLDDAVSEQDCDLLIRTAKRRQPQEITSVDDQASNVIDQTSTTMHNYQLPPRLASRTAEEEAALNRFVELVSDIFDCPPTDHETQTVRRTMPSSSSGLSLGLHVDTNLKPRRFGTALLYLCDVADGCGGETIFPLCSIESPKDPLAKAARALLVAGCTHTRRAPEELIGEARSLRLAALRTAAGAKSNTGIAVQPQRGRLLLFFSRDDHGEVESLSWHGGADVHGGGEKWTLQRFAEVPAEVPEEDFARYVSERRSRFASIQVPTTP